MDYVARTDETDVFKILQPTIDAFIPVVEKKRSQILSVKRETFKYGATERHQMDVYFPPLDKPATSKPPVLIFTYGGGFFSGDRIYPPPMDLLYVCLGSFFASRGILTVIPDYRLVPGAVYPQPSEDIRDAFAFSVRQLAEVADVNSVFLMGHSAGGTITSTLFLREPSLLSEGPGTNLELVRRVKGVILMGSAFHFDGPPSAPPHIIEAYYGASVKEDAPLGLLKSASPQTLEALPPLLIMRSEKEVPQLAQGQVDFVKLLQERTGKEVETDVAKGHNHISPHWALGSGEGEEWGERVVDWIKQHAD